MRATSLAVLLLVAAGSWVAPALALPPGEPIRLVWTEGDVAGTTAIYDATDDGSERRDPIGVVEYHQRREGTLLSTVRVARFRDGSSDEDVAVARVDGVLTAISGRSLIRDPDGQPVVDLRIDVAGGQLAATWGRDDGRRTVSKGVRLPPGTYWGPLIFIVLKNFDANAEDGRLVIRTVAPAPGPLVLDLELTRGDTGGLDRAGTQLPAREFTLRPTVHWALDPLVRWLAPAGRFWTLPGEPPALIRFAGPRNYRRESIVIE